MSSQIKIFISSHKPTEYVKGQIFNPIQVNAALNPQKLEGFSSDNTGKNISKMNPRFCELTAQYWVWKNTKADYVGFFHYRRYLDLSGNKLHKPSAWGLINEPSINANTAQKFGLEEKNIKQLLKTADVILPERLDILKMPFDKITNMREQFLESGFLHAQDLQIMLDVIKERHPDFVPYANKYINGHRSCFCNMFIMKWDIFQQYCDWLFDILFECDKRINYENYSIEAIRTPGHLAERLFNIYMLYLEDKQNAQLKEVPMVAFENTEPSTVLAPAFAKNNIPVVFAANDSFIPVFATCLQSIIETSSAKNNYDLVLIHSGLLDENKQLLLKMVSNHKNISLRFFNASYLIGDRVLEAKNHISVETYYRFLIQDAMPQYNKVLYIDCDLIVRKDLAVLYATDVSKYMLAATHDPDFAGQVNGANIKTPQYATEVLGLHDPFEYFQAGVILFNEDEMRKAHSLDEWLDFASVDYAYSDQDVLNKYCQGKVKILDMSWNLLSDCNHERVNKVIRHAPARIQEEYQNARKSPNIIHFAGFRKPWHNPAEDFGDLFWDIARRTPYYERLVYEMIHKDTKTIVRWSADYASGRRKLQRAVFKVGDLVLPKNTGRRKVVKKLLLR